MRKSLVIFIMIGFLFSCEKEENIDEVCRKEHFYYGNDEKIYIDGQLQNGYLLIGFEKIYLNSEINDFLDSQIYFNKVNLVETFDLHGYNYALIIREFTSPKSCIEIKEIIQTLQENEIVSFAAYTYEGGICIGDECTDLMSYCNEVIVALNDRNDIDKLYELIAKTDTWIEEDVGRYIIIGVDKNSHGNALQMANYFYETGIFRYTEPNFYFFNFE